MNGDWDTLSFMLATVWISILPTALWFVNRLLVQQLDNRGMYEVPPFSWLPWIAGAVLCAAALDGMEVTRQLYPDGIWLSEFWSLRFDELQALWLNPRDLFFAAVAGLIELRLDTVEGSWRPPLFNLCMLLAALVSFLAWRGWQALRGFFLFFWSTLTYMLLMYMAVIGLAWVMHWLNFWALLVIFIFLYLYDKDGDVQPRSPL